MHGGSNDTVPSIEVARSESAAKAGRAAPPLVLLFLLRAARWITLRLSCSPRGAS